MQTSNVVSAAATLTLVFAVMALSSCISCDRCTRNREAREAAATAEANLRSASYPVPAAESAAETVAW